MAGTDASAGLILSSFGVAVGLGTAGIAVVGLVYRLTRPMAETEFGPSRHSTQARPRRLTLEADERWVAAAAYRRAAGIGVALLALLVASPWLQAPLDRLADRWRAASQDQPWGYGVLAAVLWLGLLPLAAFLWALPRRAPARRGLRRQGWATRLGTSTSPGLPNAITPDDLADSPPYAAPLRRAARLRGINAALGAGRARGNTWGTVPFLALALVPPIGGLLLAGFVEAWLAAMAAAVAALGAVAAGVRARRDALRAPGTTALDYLILVSAARDGRCGDAGTRAAAYLAPNPATLQDHAALVAALAGVHWIDEPPWDTAPVARTDVVVPAAMEVVDRGGRRARVHVALRLVRDGDRNWRIARIWMEQTASTGGGRTRAATPLPVAW
jgi:hypothetical protein